MHQNILTDKEISYRTGLSSHPYYGEPTSGTQDRLLHLYQPNKATKPRSLKASNISRSELNKQMIRRRRAKSSRAIVYNGNAKMLPLLHHTNWTRYQTNTRSLSAAGWVDNRTKKTTEMGTTTRYLMVYNKQLRDFNRDDLIMLKSPYTIIEARKGGYCRGVYIHGQWGQSALLTKRITMAYAVVPTTPELTPASTISSHPVNGMTKRLYTSSLSYMVRPSIVLLMYRQFYALSLASKE